MKTLSAELRRQLERTVIQARDVAEAGARAALEALAVHHHEPYGHMSPEQRYLRRRLRAHARQLGDRPNSPFPEGEGVRAGGHGIAHLAHECACEHWHGMLFARFLAENHLLIEPDMEVAISLEECEELANEEGVDKWALAARFAHRMLPQVFRPDHSVFEVRFAREHRLKLENLVEGLPAAVFTATDSLGWVYQFWQSRKKDEVNRSEVKIGADELPAVTQLFTEPYMVKFLLHNSLGAWWVSRHPNKPCPVELTYLRVAPSPPEGEGRGEGEKRLPAAGSFEGWPNDLSEFRLLDPCCGSGHFLVAAFLMLVPMRMALEDLSAAEAVDAVLRDNLHGLELDQRCVAIAAFALALEAWRYPNLPSLSGRGAGGEGAIGYRPLPHLNLAWCGQPVAGKREQWLALAEGNGRLEAGMAALYDTFRDAPILGSLIDPPRLVSEDMLTAGFAELEPLLKRALREHAGQEEWEETAIAALGLADAANLLAGHYHLVITNVPYLARGKQDERLRKFAEARYPKAKNDLANIFLERCLELTSPPNPLSIHGEGGLGGTVSVVMPQNWLFLTSYKKFREKLLKNETWHLIARLGPGAFETISGEVVKAVLISLSQGNTSGKHDDLFGGTESSNLIRGMDVSESRTAAEKAVGLLMGEIKSVEQAQQLENPDARIVLEDESDRPLLGNYAIGLVGIQTGDDSRYLLGYWEINWGDQVWEPMQATPDTYVEFAGQSWVIRWEGGKSDLQKSQGARIQGIDALGKKGIAMHRMGTLFPYHYCTNYYHQNIAVIIPKEDSHLPAIWCFCTSPEYNAAVRQVDQSLKVTNATLVKVPFDLEHWTKVAEEKYPHGLPKPYSNDPTQWIFHGHPCGSVIWDEEKKWTVHGPLRTDATVLQVAVARLLGYHWPAEQTSAPDALTPNPSPFGRGEQDNLSGAGRSRPGEGEMELADEARAWMEQAKTLYPFGDEDGIVCLPSVRGEPPAYERLLHLLEAAWNAPSPPAHLPEGKGSGGWHEDVLAKLLFEVGASSLDDWLRNQFFEQHCKLFHHRPFIWHIWDGRKGDGFHALINCHRLAEGAGKGRRRLESLTYSYLGDWIARQQDGVKRGESGAEGRLAAALELQKRLVAIIEGEPPFDIFVRWKPIAEQPIGWELDINDGVRLNIRPFMAQDIPGGKKGAGLLRAKPNIDWKKDRGKEPVRDQAQFPWFWSNGRFMGERVNDVHLTNAEKRAAREWAEARK